MLTPQEKNQIKRLLESPYWQIAKRVAELKIKKISETPKIADTEWETVKNVLASEGKCNGIREFIQELANLAQ